MATETKIQWTDSTFNPWRGCTKVHTGCTHCYAETLAKRNPNTLGIWGPHGKRVLASNAIWKQPVKWNMEAAAYDGQHRVFCASLADVFEDWQGPITSAGKDPVYLAKNGRASSGKDRMTLDDVRQRLFELIDNTPNLTWQILTKRPGNIRKMWPELTPAGNLDPIASAPYGHSSRSYRKNVHLLYSASDQESLEAGIGELLKCRDLVPVLGLSLEPLVGPIDLAEYTGAPFGGNFQNRLIDWVIIGGESGHGARPCNVEWIRDIIAQCKAAGVPCFVKQLGARIYDSSRHSANPKYRTVTQEDIDQDPEGVAQALHDELVAMSMPFVTEPKGGDWSEWPADLRVREFPGVPRG